MAQQNDTPKPMPKRDDWTDESVQKAAFDFAHAQGLHESECNAFALNTLHFWRLGNATVVTHTWPKK